MKAGFAAIAVIGLLTLSVIAVGVSALGEARDAGAANTAAAESAPDGDDNAVVTSFRFVCPFH